MKKATILLIGFLVGGIWIIGCLEREVTIIINNDGSCDYSFHARGDKEDLYDQKCLLPEGDPWTIKEFTTVERKDTVYHCQAKRHFDSAAQLPQNLAPPETKNPGVYLQHPVTFFRRDYFFITYYSFRQTYQSRDKIEKYGGPNDFYPTSAVDTTSGELKKELSREDKDSLEIEAYLGWYNQVVLDWFKKALNQALKESKTLGIKPLDIKKAEEALEFYIADFFSISKTEAILSGDWPQWDDVKAGGLEVIGKQLELAGKATLRNAFEETFDKLQMEFNITQDLEDENFKIAIIFPGELRRIQGGKVNRDTARWEFSGEDIMDEDYTIFFESRLVHDIRIVITTTLFVLLVSAIIWWVNRRKGRIAKYEAG